MEHTPYYRHLAETVVRAWDESPTSPTDKMYVFFDFGLVYGPSDLWPDTLVEAWSVGGMPSPTKDLEWPCHENMEKMVEHCRAYLEETA